jgi:hypothetical protein
LARAVGQFASNFRAVENKKWTRNRPACDPERAGAGVPARAGAVGRSRFPPFPRRPCRAEPLRNGRRSVATAPRRAGIKPDVFEPVLTMITMTLAEATSLIRSCVEQMNTRYRRTVFDEWAVVNLREGAGRVLSYHGPRRDDFHKNFARDLDALRQDIASRRFGVGDFEFARHGVGTKFEAFLVLGEGLYLICNNTGASMEEISRDPRWLGAQVPFVELSDRVRANPVTTRD